MNGTYRPDDPNNPGFASGVWADGGKIYPGSGSFTAVGCSLQNPGVAMIRTSSPSGAGAYQSYGAKPQCFDGVNAQFILKTSNLAWRTTTTLGVATILNTPMVGGNKIGRVNVNAPNGTIYQSIGRIVLGRLYYYKQGDTSESSTNNFDVLVCN